MENGGQVFVLVRYYRWEVAKPRLPSFVAHDTTNFAFPILFKVPPLESLPSTAQFPSFAPSCKMLA